MSKEMSDMTLEQLDRLLPPGEYGAITLKKETLESIICLAKRGKLLDEAAKVLPVEPKKELGIVNNVNSLRHIMGM